MSVSFLTHFSVGACRNMGLFCRNLGLVSGWIGPVSGHIWLFCGCIKFYVGMAWIMYSVEGVDVNTWMCVSDDWAKRALV